MTDNEFKVKVENLPMDINVNELQAQGGYINAFLNDHMMIMAAVTNINQNDIQSKLITATLSIELKVSLITDEKVRDDLYNWYEEECKKKVDTSSVASEVKTRYYVAIVLLGKIMSFVGKHLSKPIEIGME